MKNHVEKNHSFSEIYVQVGDTPKHAVFYLLSLGYVAILVKLPDSTALK